MRGYFGIGVEGLSKPMNAGNLYRSAHAFGAGFVFTVASSYDPDIRKSDTSDVTGQVPFYSFETLESMRLPAESRAKLLHGAALEWLGLNQEQFA